MDLRKDNDGWWIVDVPDTPPCGPYTRRAEAAADMRGLRRFFRYGDAPEFLSSERRIAMKKDEVKVGGLYTAKVSDKVVPVRIDALKGTGWSATNTVTGKRIYIKSAQRLRGGVADGGQESAESASQKGEAAGKATKSPTVATGGKKGGRGTTEARPKKAATRAKQGEKKAKRPSGLDAAARVLAEAEEPMTCREIVEAAFEKSYWKSGGKTPHATVYSAMIREIAAKGKDARFQKVDRGKFAANLATKG